MRGEHSGGEEASCADCGEGCGVEGAAGFLVSGYVEEREGDLRVEMIGGVGDDDCDDV